MMKKYIKQLALSVLTLCMIFTLATGNVTHAENIGINVGDPIKISYLGRNITKFKETQSVKTEEENNSGRPLTMLNGDKGVLINPTANVNWYSLCGYAKDFVRTNEGKKPDINTDKEKFYTDELGNEFFTHLVDKTQNINSTDYQFVGWKAMNKSDYIDMGLNMFGYIDEFVYPTYKEAEANITFKDGYISLNQWNAAVNSTGQTNPNELFLVAVYTIKRPEVKVGTPISIHYIGANLNAKFYLRDHYTSTTMTGKNMVMPAGDEILINPMSNIGWTDFFEYNREVAYDKRGEADYNSKKHYFTDDFGNTYYGYRTEQIYEGKKYQLVGWTYATTYNTDPDKYLEKFSYNTVEEAEEHCILLNNEEDKYIGPKEWNEIVSTTGQKDLTTLHLAAVYTPAKVEFGKGEYNYDGTSKWDVERNQLEKTSNEIDTKVDFTKREIVFTIPEGYTNDTIQLTLDDELVELFAFHFGQVKTDITENGKGQGNNSNKKIPPYIPQNKPGVNLDSPFNQDFDKEQTNIQPGDLRDFKIKIVNKSKYDYGYLNNSLNITTPNLEYYNQTNDYTDPMPNGMKGFDGQRLMKAFTPTRTLNEAMLSLIGDKESGSILGNDLNLSTLLNKLYNPDSEGAKLLNKYYIDYYNSKFSTSNTKLEDFSSSQLLNMFKSGEHSSMYTESNKEVAETLYNYFYNEVLGVAPKGTMGNSGSLNNKYSVGNIMRNDNNILTDYNQYMLNQIKSVSSNNEDGGLVSWEFKVDGLKATDIFNNMDYGFEMGFKLEKKVADVTVDKHIELGGFDKNNTPTFMFKLTDVNGNTYFKTISFNEGETDKQVVFKDIPYGKYTVEEIDPIRYEVLGQPVLEGVLDDVKQSGYVQYVNTKVKDNDFSDTNLVINSFKKGDNSIEISKKEHNNGKRG